MKEQNRTMPRLNGKSKNTKKTSRLIEMRNNIFRKISETEEENTYQEMLDNIDKKLEKILRP
jgi:hypothetical protein